MTDNISKNSLMKQELLKFEYRKSGDKKGSSCKVSLSTFDKDKALLTINNISSYNKKPLIEEHYIDSKALTEIKDLVIKEGIYKWNGKKFADKFIADGPSTTYSFMFTDDDISFKSQKYPKIYAEKLNHLNNLIDKYKNS